MPTTPLHERNLNYAKMAVANVSWKMKLGANNKLPDVLSSGLKSFFCVPRTREHYEHLPFTLETIRKVSLHATQAECGNCGEQAAIAFMWLLERDIGPLDYMTRTNKDHAFVLVGRTNLSNNSADWNENCVVCDPWDLSAYYLSETSKKMYGGGVFAPKSVVRWPSE